MKDIIKLNSRYKMKNYLRKVEEISNRESETYVLKSEMPTLRTGYIDEKHKFIDPPGGPMIVEGSRLEEADAVVKSIDFVMSYGYIITFL